MKEPALFPESGFFRLRLDFSYDGTNYQGWARQPDFPTIQGALEAAFWQLARIDSPVITAGRTDAGVHASGAVAHIDLPEDFKYEVENTAYRLNRILDADIRILGASLAPVGFNARFSASARRYEYRLLDGNQLLAPLRRYNTATWYRHLDLDALNQASSVLLGEHDFAAFCRYREGATSIRNLCEFSWARNDEGLLIASIEADAFCYNMVRNLVGAAVCVGEGRFGVDWIQRVLTEKSRVSDSYVFPARGLTLTRVSYPEPAALQAQALRVLGKRELAAD